MRKTWNCVAILAVVAMVGCGINKGGTTTPDLITAPSIDVPFNPSPVVGALSLVTGTWTGSETATVGQSGTLSVTFTQPPTPDGVVAANLVWTSAATSLIYNGTLTGTISSMVITVTAYLPGDTACGYTATGALNEAGTQLTGTYAGTGPAPCPTKAGSFILNGKSYVKPVITAHIVASCPSENQNNQQSVEIHTNTTTPDCKVNSNGSVDLKDGKSVTLTATVTSTAIGDTFTYLWKKVTGSSGAFTTTTSNPTSFKIGGSNREVYVTVSDTAGADSVDSNHIVITSK